jgi:hypothetical protein
VAPADLPTERLSVGAFGVEIAGRNFALDLGRPFMARFGDIRRIRPLDGDIRVTLKSGSEFDLQLSGSDDLGDGLRIWDLDRGVVDLSERQINDVELLAAPNRGNAPLPLYGTVQTRAGEFTGLVQWHRAATLGDDELSGFTDDGPLSLRFDTIRSIKRDSQDDSWVTLLDGTEVGLSGDPEVSSGNRGLHVDDLRYGRVLIPWESLEQVDFSDGGLGPTYDDFPTGGPLTGAVVTRSGRQLRGRLVYDLDESETTETLDAPSQGVNYMIPFGLIASIALPALGESGAPRAAVTLHSGEELPLELSGDLGELNGGMLIFAEGSETPEYVPWTEVERIELDRPAEMYPRGG